MKPLLPLLLLLAITVTIILLLRSKAPLITPVSGTKQKTSQLQRSASLQRLKKYRNAAKEFARQKGFSLRYQFLIDMSLPSGKKRFFIFDASKDSIIHAGLVAHGSCRTKFLSAPEFSNVPECGCSSVGKYKIGYPYEGSFGKAFKLHGLDSSNSNAFKRTVVLHAYDCVPDEEVEPYGICNSLGCPMVSYKFLDTVAAIIDRSKKPILLWIFN